jgi:DNA repair protein SbcC/Rad50
LRPTRLELDGFASFREPTIIDFTDADLFVLSGPTGAGKSSVIDAIVFALYGTVPRYDDRRKVAPVISQGQPEARVRLDFTVGDADYTAVRVVRRTKTGATTKEARLEWHRGSDSDPVTLAGTADDLSAAVERVLGLSFEHFTTCVVLPQGAFQEFLHAKPSERQDLLVELLDLDVYRKIGQAARERARDAQREAELLQRRLDGEFATVTPEALAAATDRVAVLEVLLHDLDAGAARLVAIEEEGRRQRDLAAQATARARLLTGLQVPDGVTALAARVETARGELDRAEAAAEAAGSAVETAEESRTAAGDATPLAQQLDRLDRRQRLAEREQQAADDVATADGAAAAATAAHEAALSELTAARGTLDTARRRDLAATLAADLAVGDDCPVCLRPLEELPGHAPSGDVAAAEAALAAATRAADAAEAGRREQERRQAAAAGTHKDLVHQLTELDDEIALVTRTGIPTDRTDLTAAVERIRTLDDALTATRADEKAAHARRRAASDAVAAASGALTGAWDDFDAAWRGVADLAPPAPDRSDLGAAWQQLVDWAAARAPQLVAEADAAQAAVDATRRSYRDELSAMTARCAEHDITLAADESPRDACLREAERARTARERLAQQLEAAARLRGEVTAAVQRHRIARDLGQHLDANRFERWLLRRALQRLVVGATRILRDDLSGGAYSLCLDDQEAFAVVDHRNADEIRSARTLSGGETFLASLALALALAEDVANLAAEGAARLECLILDEGFGTLDADTLDVVATALEELGSKGRMVGVITHVPTLAERLPIRFDVRKVAGTSTIERVA